MGIYDEWKAPRDPAEYTSTAALQAERLRLIEIQKLNNKQRDSYITGYKAALRAVAAIWGEDSRQAKYIRSECYPGDPPSFEKRWRTFARAVERERENEKRRNAARESYRERVRINNELVEKGYVPWEDYHPGRAITFSKTVMDENGVIQQKSLPEDHPAEQLIRTAE